MSVRDITLEDTFYALFSTRAFSTGAPTTLAGTPVVSAYENDSLTQITAGITLGVDHDSVTGLNLLTVVATAANGYESGKDYALVITTGTVDSVSVVGSVVSEFTIGRSAAAVDLANGTDGLGVLVTDTEAVLADTETATAVLTDTEAILADTNELQTDWADAGRLDAILDAVLVDTETVATVITDTEAILADTEAATAVLTDTEAILADTNELQTDWTNAGRLDAILDAVLVDTETVATVITDTEAILADTEANAAVLTDTEAILADAEAILLDTAEIGAAGAGLTAVPWNASWDAEVQSEVDDALDTAIAELGVAAPTATPTIRTGLMLLYMMTRNKLVVQTSGTDAIEVYNDAGTKIAAKTITDDGSDYTEAEMA